MVHVRHKRKGVAWMTMKRRLKRAVSDFKECIEIHERLSEKMIDSLVTMITRKTLTTMEWKRLKRIGKEARRKRMKIG
jgi:hypothetical protein